MEPYLKELLPIYFSITLAVFKQDFNVNIPEVSAAKILNHHQERLQIKKPCAMRIVLLKGFGYVSVVCPLKSLW